MYNIVSNEEESMRKLTSIILYTTIATFVISGMAVLYSKKFVPSNINATSEYNIVIDETTSNDWTFLNSEDYDNSFYTFRNTQFAFENAKLSRKIQLQLKENDGTIYNTLENKIDNHAISGVTSITVNYNSSDNLIMYFGNEPKPINSNMNIELVSGETTNISDYSAFRYIAIKAGYDDVTISKINITYSCIDTSYSYYPSSLEVAMNKIEFVEDEFLNPNEDINVNVVYSNSYKKSLNYDENGINGWKFDLILGPDGEEFNIDNPLVAGDYLFSISYTENNKTITYEDGEFTVLGSSTLNKEDLLYTIKDLSDNSYFNTPAMPSIGSPTALIVPVWLTDSNKFIDETQKDKVRQDIEKAYLGTTEETGWHSVKSFYYEESRGKLNLNGVVTDWYDSSYSSSINSYQTNILVEEVADWYKDQVTTSEYNALDSDKDGYLDAVILIYGCPNSYNNNGNLWAYCFWLAQYNQNVNSPIPNTYFWASYDFMYEDDYFIVDAHTYIHEMGHILGLNDYYDYASGSPNRPAASFSMQDYNVGGHDPYSVMALAWVSPYVPKDDAVITINTFQESGDLILLSPNFSSSPFDEYLLLELYSPTGLNEVDASRRYAGIYPQGPDTVGIRLWHVDSRLNQVHNGYLYPTQYYTNFDDIDNCDGYLIDISNTTRDGTNDNYASSEYNADYDLLALIRNSDASDSGMNYDLNSDMLFYEGDYFSMDDYRNAFPKGNKLNSGLDLGFDFRIISLDDTSATIEITKI